MIKLTEILQEASKLGVITGTQEKELNAGLRNIHHKHADFRRFVNDKTFHSKINYGGCGAFAKLLYFNMRKYLNITPEIVCLDYPDHQIQPGEINDYKSLQAYNEDGNMCIHLLLRIGDYYIDSSGIHKLSWYENQVYGIPLAVQEGMTIQTLTSWVSSGNNWNPTFNRYGIGDINDDMVKVLKVVKKAGIKK